MLTETLKPIDSPRLLGGSALIAEVDWQAVADRYGLTARASQAARLYFQGLELKEIAREMDCAYETVHSFIRQVHESTGTHTRAQFIHRVMVDWLDPKNGLQRKAALVHGCISPEMGIASQPPKLYDQRRKALIRSCKSLHFQRRQP